VKVKAATDRRFRRTRVRPVRRRRWRTILNGRALARIGAVAIALYAGYLATEIVTRSSIFRISRVVVRGNARLSTGEVLATVSGLRDRSILAANLERERARLLQSSWVAEASLRRVLPKTVEITLIERTPIGLCRIGSRLYLVDGEGAVIDEHGPQYADLDLPIIDGLASGPRGGQRRARDSRRGCWRRLRGIPIWAGECRRSTCGMPTTRS
jgi:cell division septal protein FtsQ